MFLGLSRFRGFSGFNGGLCLCVGRSRIMSRIMSGLAIVEGSIYRPCRRVAEDFVEIRRRE